LVAKSYGGYANHAQFSALAVIVIVAILWRPLRSSEREKLAVRRSDELIVWLCSLALLLPYTYTGMHRLMNGGLEIFTGDAIMVYVDRACGEARTMICTASGALLKDHLGHVLRCGFAMMTLCELASVVVPVWRGFRIVWLVSMTSLHLVTAVLMNVVFWENALLLWAVCGNTPRVGGSVRACLRLLKGPAPRFVTLRRGIVLSGCAFAVALFTTACSDSVNTFDDEVQDESEALAGLKVVWRSQAAYSKVCGGGAFATSFTDLGAPIRGERGVLPLNMAKAIPIRGGYRFELRRSQDGVPKGHDCNGAETVSEYYLSAVPVSRESTAAAAFATNSQGVIWKITGSQPPGEPLGPPAVKVQ
jgi:hypothetical protein